jgi:hypothetical protein
MRATIHASHTMSRQVAGMHHAMLGWVKHANRAGAQS